MLAARGNNFHVFADCRGIRHDSLLCILQQSNSPAYGAVHVPLFAAGEVG